MRKHGSRISIQTCRWDYIVLWVLPHRDHHRKVDDTWAFEEKELEPRISIVGEHALAREIAFEEVGSVL
jgi:hypothetical protein